jgi:autotransporter-associated beta strand protein
MRSPFAFSKTLTQNHMKPSHKLLHSFLAPLALFYVSHSHAQVSGTWNVDNSGNWSDTANWTGGAVASGATATANFSTINVTATRTVTLDVPITIGTLTAQDATTASHDWLFSGTETLTLNNDVNQPLITVANRTTTLDLPLSGSNGIRKNGAGILALSGNNTNLSGTLTLDDVAGTNNAGVAIANSAAIGGITAINISGTTTTGAYLELRNGTTIPSTVAITLNSPGGNNAPGGAIRSTGTTSQINRIDGPINVTLNLARISNNTAQRLDIYGAITGGTNSIMFRNAANEGIYLDNTANAWTGTTVHSGGNLWFKPGALPSSNLNICASDPGTIQTSGTLTRALGTGVNQMNFAPTATRAQGFGARGGDLTINFGGAAAEVFFDTNTGAAASTIRTSTLVLNGATSDSKLTLQNPLNLNGAARTIQVDANTAAITGGINGTGAFNLTKTGPGTLDLNGPVAHGGGLILNAGTLRISGVSTQAGNTTLNGGILEIAEGNNRLPVTSTVTFAASSTIDLIGVSQTLSTFTTPDQLNVTLTAKGTGSLTINGATNLQIGPNGTTGAPVTSAHAVNMNMSELNQFVFNSSATVFRVGLKSGAQNSGNLGNVATLTLANTNTITASTFAVGDQGANNHGGLSTVNLGGATTINSGAINSGASGRSNSIIQFDVNRLNPTLTIRGLNGTAPLPVWNVGSVANFTASTWTDTVNLATGNSDILLTTLNLGQANTGTQANRGGIENASFTMGQGSLIATTINMGVFTGESTSTITSTMAANGTLTLNHPSGLIRSNTVNFTTNTVLAGGTAARSVSATLNLQDGTLEAASITRGTQGGNATVSTAFNWTNGKVRNISGGDLVFNTVPIALASGIHTFEATGSNSIIIDAASLISGTGGFVKTGSGQLVLNGVHPFSGIMEVDEGTLAINGNLPVNAQLQVEPTATLQLSNTALTYNSSSQNALSIAGNLVLSGPVRIDFNSITPGTYTVLEHGSITGTANLTSNLRSASFNSTATTTSIIVSNGIGLTWTGANGDVWNLNDAINWKNASDGAEKFYWLDGVTFDEAGATVQPNVVLSGEQRPSAMVVNSTTDYTISGTGGLGGSFPLTKNGSSTLTLGGTNTFTGGISLLGGTIKAASDSALGGIGQNITVASGAALDFNGNVNASRDYTAVISGTGISATGAVTNSGANINGGLGSLTLAANASIGGIGNWQISPVTAGTTQVNLAGFTLTKTGGNTVSMVDGTLSSEGSIQIDEGTLLLARMSVSGSGNINVNTGTTLRLNNYSSGFISKPINLTDSTLGLAGANNFTLEAPVSITGNSTISAASGRNFSLSAALTGTGSLTKTDPGNVLLLENCTYQGNTTINGGTLFFGNRTANGAPNGNEIITNGAVRFGRSVNSTIANTISGSGSVGIGANVLVTAEEWVVMTTLTGNNTFTGNITVFSGGLIIPSASALGTGTKTISLNTGSNGRPQFYLDGTNGNITVPATVSFVTSSNNAAYPPIGNLAGDNVIEGSILLQSGGGGSVVSVLGGSLTLNGQISSATTLRDLRLAGASGTSGVINGLITDGSASFPVIMQGSNTWTLTNDGNNYSGTTTLNSGTLLINGNQTGATGAVTVNDTATLGGTGTVGGAITANTGSTIAPGVTVGTLTTSAAVSIKGSLAIQFNATTADRLTVGGALTLDTSSTLTLTELAAPTQPVYIIASYTSLSGTFGTVTGLPTGYTLVYNYNDQNQIALVGQTQSPYLTWLGGYPSLVEPADKLPTADPDGDGKPNIFEFAFKGNPTSRTDEGSFAGLVQDASAPTGKELTFITAVRRGAVFSAGPNGTQTATIDGVVYAIEGSLDLNFPNSNVSHIGASDTAPADTGLPSLIGQDWEYRTFKLDASEGTPNRGFLRGRASVAP